jgi:ABC-type transporter Mla subunit MlaD
LAALGFLAMQVPAKGFQPFGSARGYRITAEFDNIGALEVGDPVTMAGVPVGEVEGSPSIVVPTGRSSPRQGCL